MQPISYIAERIKQAGLIYDQLITATILNYEAGYVARTAFYAAHEPDPGVRAGNILYLKTELSDLVMQARLLANSYGFDWSSLTEMGEKRVIETAEKYESRKLKPHDVLAARLAQSMPADPELILEPDRPLIPDKPAFVYQREGD